MKLLNAKARLTEYLEQQAKTPFEWGLTDCCHFVAGAAEAQTGQPVAQDLPCSSVTDALRVFLTHGRDVGQLADRYFKVIGAADVAYGDVVAVKVSITPNESAFGDVSLGVFLGDRIAVKSPHGLIDLPPVFLKAWRVD